MSGRVGGNLGAEVSGVGVVAKNVGLFVDALFLLLESDLFQVSGHHRQLCPARLNGPLPGPPSRLPGSWSF